MLIRTVSWSSSVEGRPLVRASLSSGPKRRIQFLSRVETDPKRSAQFNSRNLTRSPVSVVSRLRLPLPESRVGQSLRPCTPDRFVFAVPSRSGADTDSRTAAALDRGRAQRQSAEAPRFDRRECVLPSGAPDRGNISRPSAPQIYLR